MLASDEAQMALIYGRRRVGKSELVKQFIKESDVKSIYYECRQVTEASNIQGISEVVSEALNLPALGYSSFESLMDFIFSKAKDEKIIFVLDEYSYLRENTRGIDSILQALIDKYREKSMLKLIILGSCVDIMKSLIAHSNPLFGRVDLVINLKQMDYYDSAKFYPAMSDEDKVRIYSVFGSVMLHRHIHSGPEYNQANQKAGIRRFDVGVDAHHYNHRCQ